MGSGMLRFIVLVIGFWFTAVGPSVAENAPNEPLILGYGRLFSNDYLGDGRDRWQSGSYVQSFMAGRVMDGAQPFGSLREYRLRTAVIASDGFGPKPGDRPYVGLVSLGLHSHFGTGSTQSRVGVDVSVIGPRTQLSDFQEQIHEVLGLPQVRFTDSQLGNDTLVGLSAETARIFNASRGVTARPFGEVQIGPEDTVRIGADVFLGGSLANGILIRDVTTGQLYTALTDNEAAGFSFVVGADTAFVADSAFLPGGDLAAPSDRRDRARVGVHWTGTEGASVFYGITYLGPEFEDQNEGQVTGSVKLNFNF